LRVKRSKVRAKLTVKVKAAAKAKAEERDSQALQPKIHSDKHLPPMVVVTWRALEQYILYYTKKIL